MRKSQPTIAEVRQLPPLMSYRIPGDWQDLNGHVNVKYYMTLYELAGWPIIAAMGIDEDYFVKRRCGMFDLEHHITYLSELHVGETVSMYMRLVGSSPKRIHGMFYVLNDTREQLANTLEFVTTGADLEQRRTAAFPDDIAARFDDMLEQHKQLDWPVALCGVMSA